MGDMRDSCQAVVILPVPGFCKPTDQLAAAHEHMNSIISHVRCKKSASCATLVVVGAATYFRGTLLTLLRMPSPKPRFGARNLMFAVMVSRRLPRA
jgi:hypothetical protein